MKIKFALIGFFLLIFTSCDWMMEGGSSGVRLQNNSDSDVVFAASLELRDGRYRPYVGWPKDDKHMIVVPPQERKLIDLGFQDDSGIDPADVFISLFVLHPDTLAKYTLIEMERDDNYLKRFDMNILDLPWVLNYP